MEAEIVCRRKRDKLCEEEFDFFKSEYITGNDI